MWYPTFGSWGLSALTYHFINPQIPYIRLAYFVILLAQPSSMSEAQDYEKQLLDRVSMFNDAVYAIVLTLLVLELHIPELVNADSMPEMWKGMREMSPKLYAFALSVVLVGGNWVSSVNLQRVLAKTNETCIVLSVTYLIIISLFPFCCEVIGNYPQNPGSYLLFGILAIAMTTNAYFWMRNINKHKLLHKHADYAEWQSLMKKLPFILPYLALVSLSAFISTQLSFFLFMFTNLMPFFLTRSFKLRPHDE